MLEVTSLTRAFGHHLAIADISMQVADGELVTIVGPSGCGKSTLLRCVAGLLPPTSGQVVLNGVPVTRVPDRLAVVFQDYSRSLYPWLTVAANVALPLLSKARQQGQPKGAARGGRAARRASRGARWNRWGWPGSPTGTRGSFPAACSSGSPSPAHWPATRCCC